MESGSTRWIAIEWVGPQALRAVLAGAVVAALAVYITSDPAVAHAADSPAPVRSFTTATLAPPPTANPVDITSAKTTAAFGGSQARATSRILPVDDSDDDDAQQQANEEALQQSEELDQMAQETEETNNLNTQAAQEEEQTEEQDNEMQEQADQEEEQEAEQQSFDIEQQANNP